MFVYFGAGVFKSGIMRNRDLSDTVSVICAALLLILLAVGCMEKLAAL